MSKQVKRKRQIIVIFLIGIITSTVIYFSFTFNFNKVYQLLLDKDITQITYTSHFVTKLIESEIGHLIFNLNIKQRRLVNDTSREKIIEDLDTMCTELNFEKTGLVKLNGEAVDHQGNQLTLDNPSLLEAISNNSEYISDTDKDDTMLLAVPIVKDGNIIGGLWGHYRIENISKTIELNEDSHRYFQIVDSLGHYISASKNVNSFASDEIIWGELQRYELHDGVTIQEIQDNVINGRSGEFHFTYQGNGRYVYYEPLGINNWYVFSVLTEGYLTDYVDNIENIFTVLLWSVLGCGLIILAMIGRSIYVATNIMQRNNKELASRNSLLFMVMKHTKDSPFEIDMKNRKITIYLSKENEKIVEKDLDELQPDNMLKSGYLYEEDYDIYKNIFDSIMELKTTRPAVVKFKLDEQWDSNKIHYNVISDDLVIGFLEDYNKLTLQNEKIKEMNEKSQIDVLTTLYNRTTFIQKVEDVLKHKQNNTYCALFILDLDFFKQANDTLGHMMGDQILKESALMIKSIVRSTDICGRLGGDEFMLFIQDAKNINAIELCAKKINFALNHTYSKDGKDITISASIGIVAFKEERTFNELYQLADQALYKVKEQNRNNFYIISLQDNQKR